VSRSSLDTIYSYHHGGFSHNAALKRKVGVERGNVDFKKVLLKQGQEYSNEELPTIRIHVVNIDLFQ